MQIGNFKIECTNCSSKDVTVVERYREDEKSEIILKCKDCKVTTII